MQKINAKSIILRSCILFIITCTVFLITTLKVSASGIPSNVAFGNGIFVAVGETENISKSIDGVSWSTVNTGMTFSKVVFGNGIFLATDGTDTIYKSIDGSIWTSNHIPIIAQGLKEANGKFFVWRSDYIDGTNPPSYNSKLLVSQDGVNWNDTNICSTGPIFGMQMIGDITFGNGKYVVSASSSAATFYTSTDLLTWTTVELTDIVNNSYGSMWPWIYNVTYLNGRFFSYCSGGCNDIYHWSAANKVLTSTDGSNWLIDSSWDNNRFTGGLAINSVNILLGENGFIYHCDGNPAPLTFSSWTTSNTNIDATFSSIAYGNSKYVACGDSGLAVSPDLVNWSSVSTTATISSFNIQAPTETVTNANSVTYRITFGTGVTGLTTSNFELNTSVAGASITGVSAVADSSNTQWDITVNTGTGDGDITPVLINSTGCSPNITTTMPYSGQSYTIDKTPPSVNIGTPSTLLTTTGPVAYNITYSDANFDSSTLSESNITLNKTGTADGTLSVSGSGSVRTVTISSITGNGTLGISISSATASDTVGNTAPAAGPSATFTVDNAPPSIDTQPSNAAVTAGNNTSIAVAAAGSVTYQWQVNTGGSFANVSNGGVYGGATTATLTITGAAADMNGYVYRCIVTGANMLTTTSNDATLTVNIPPAITSQPSNASVNEGDYTSFTAAATGTGLSYQWQVNTGLGFVDITDDSVYSGATTATLTITDATAVMNNYQYKVVVSGTVALPATSNTVTLTVNTPPTISTQPGDANVDMGNNTNLTVVAAGVGLTYQWQVDTGSGFVNITNGGVYGGATTATLTITGAVTGMNGYIYRCVVTGAGALSTNSGNATLTVNIPPSITSQPSNASVNEGDHTSFTAAATGIGLSYQWQVDIGSGFVNITNGGVYSGATTATLKITGASRAMTGYKYQVVVTGAVAPAATSTIVTLTVNALPYTPPVVTPPTNNNDTETRVVSVVVDNGGQQTTAVQVPITRTTDSDGTKKDTVQFDEDKAKDTVTKALEANTDTATITVTDIPGNNADKVEVQVPQSSMTQLGNNSIGLTVKTEKLSLELPKETVSGLKDKDAQIQISEVKDSSEVEETKGLILKLASGSQLITTPIKIDANYAARTKITLPIYTSKLPTSKEEVEKFLSSLAVMVQHSDGENVVDKGTIVYDKNGNLIGISIWVDKFSDFTLVSLPESYFQGKTTVMKDKVAVDKEWQIKFTKPADVATITKDNIYITDLAGNKVEVKVSYGSDNILKVTPVNSYKSGETYYLYISKNVKAKDKTSLVNELRYQFTIK